MNACGFNSAIVQQGRLLQGIHGLRGFAAFAVVLYHLNHLAGLTPPSFFEFIGRDFGYSVHLFFVLSAFSLFYSTESRTIQNNWLSEYFIKRFFRIAPLFYFMITVEITRQLCSAGKVVTEFSNILLNITFTFGFVPFSSVVWAGWAVGVEMIFYAFLPVLILIFRSHRSAIVLLFFSILISYLIRSALHAQHVALIPKRNWDWSYFAFASNLCFFAMGIYAYHLSRQLKDSVLTIRILSIFVTIIIGGLLFFGLQKYLPAGGGRWDIILWGMCFMALCVWQSVSPSLFFANKVSEYLGERSFSIYLLHPVIMFHSKVHLLRTYEALHPHIGAYAFFVCGILIVIAILLLSEITYRLIEVPGIHFGRRLISRRKLV